MGPWQQSASRGAGVRRDPVPGRDRSGRGVRRGHPARDHPALPGRDRRRRPPAPIVTTSGITITPAAGPRRRRGPVDTFVVAGGDGVHAALADAELVADVRRIARRARRVASVCTGAFLLAEAGLLDGRRVTTHWASLPPLAREYPDAHRRSRPDLRARRRRLHLGRRHRRHRPLPRARRGGPRPRPRARRSPASSSCSSSARAARRSSAATSRPSSPSATRSPRCRPGSPTTSTRTCRSPRLAERAAMSPRHFARRVPGRDRRDARPGSSSRPASSRPAAGSRSRASASRRSRTTAASAPPRRCGGRSCRALWVGPSEYRQRFRAAANATVEV